MTLELKRPYTPATLAERWECSAEHVRRLLSSGQLQGFKLGAKLWRIAAFAIPALGGLLLLGSSETALAVIGRPPTCEYGPGTCNTCIECEDDNGECRCVKCETDLACAGCPIGKVATAKDEVDVYDSPVQPRKVIGTMIPGEQAPILDGHPDGWCKLQVQVAPDLHEGWVAQDHLKLRPEE